MFDGYFMAILTTLSLAVSPPPNGAALSPPLVEPDWLEQRLGRADLVVLDIRNPYGNAGRRTSEEGHIPGAVYSNYITDAWHDSRTEVSTTLPPVAQLEALLGRLGISNGSRVVIVHSGTGSSDFSAAARVYWIFRMLGHERVSILNGGYRAWLAAGLPVEQDWSEVQPRVFVARERPDLVATTAYVDMAVRHGAQLVDARAHNQPTSAVRIPHAVPTGTLPGAKSLEHVRLIDPKTGRFIDRRALLALLNESGVTPGRVTVVFCSAGHWSATTWFALHAVMGYRNVKLYDGSIVEWGASAERPMVTIDRTEG